MTANKMRDTLLRAIDDMYATYPKLLTVEQVEAKKERVRTKYTDTEITHIYEMYVSAEEQDLKRGL